MILLLFFYSPVYVFGTYFFFFSSYFPSLFPLTCLSLTHHGSLMLVFSYPYNAITGSFFPHPSFIFFLPTSTSNSHNLFLHYFITYTYHLPPLLSLPNYLLLYYHRPLFSLVLLSATKLYFSLLLSILVFVLFLFLLSLFPFLPSFSFTHDPFLELPTPPNPYFLVSFFLTLHSLFFFCITSSLPSHSHAIFSFFKYVNCP